jgi:hypothetical protein
MDIAKLAQKPQLQKLTLDDADIVERFGEPISFWIYDHMGISTYFNFYKLQQSEDDNLLNDLLRKIILKEDGSPAVGPEEVLPVQLVLSILMRINDFLGKSNTKASLIAETGKQPS